MLQRFATANITQHRVQRDPTLLRPTVLNNIGPTCRTGLNGP